MKMRTRIGVVLALLVAACLGLLWWFVTLPGRQLEAAKLEYAAHGADYTLLIDPLTNELVHVFRMPLKTHDAGLDALPDLPFDFGLDLRDTQVTGAGLQKLQGLKRLYYLELPGPLTDGMLRVLQANGQLRALPRATGKDGRRSLRDEDITFLSLSGTLVTGDGVAECIAGLRNLKALELSLPNKHVGDSLLKVLREHGLLHALPMAGTPDGKRQFRDEDLISLNLSGARVTNAGAKELRGLKNLTGINLTGTQISDEALEDLGSLEKLRGLSLKSTKVTGDGLAALLRSLKDLSYLEIEAHQLTDSVLQVLGENHRFHVLAQAATANKGAPARDEDITSLDLRRTLVTNAGLKQIRELKNLTRLNLPEQVTAAGLSALRGLENLSFLDLPDARVTDGVLKILRENGQFHILPLAATLRAPREDMIRILRPAEEGDIKYLDLRDTPVTEAGLMELRGLRSLTYLDLQSARVTDGVLKVLRGNGQLHALPLAFPSTKPGRDEEIISLSLAQTAVTNAGLKELRGLVNLEYLSLPDAEQNNTDRPTYRVTEAALVELQGHKKLNHIAFTFPITDRVLKVLRDNSQLHVLPVAKAADGNRPTGHDGITYLNLSNAKVTDVGLAELGELKKLTYLNLERTAVTNEGLKEIKGLTGLTSLILQGTKVTDAGLKELGGLKNLTTLVITGTKVTDKGLKELGGLKNLTTLVIMGTKVTVDGLKELRVLDKLDNLWFPFPPSDNVLKVLRENGQLHAMPRAVAIGGKRPSREEEVNSLVLWGPEVTDVGLEQLGGLKGLTNLTLDRTKVTKEGVAKLQKALPRCRITNSSR